MIKAAIYARFSSANQRDASIDDQIRICKSYCKDKDITVVAEYADRAISGRTDDRPDFQRMIKDAEKHLFEVLVLYSLDRFSRDKYASAIYKARLKRAGVRLVYVTTPIGDGAEAVLMEALLEGMAQYYSENLARNVKRGLEGNALKCMYASGHIPLGYKVDPITKHYLIDDLTAPIVRRIFEEYAAGDSKSIIIKRLNADGIKTATGKPFEKNSLYGILRQEMYIGIYHWNDIRIEGGVPAIITRDLWDRAQEVKAHYAVAKARAKAKEDYMLTSKLICGHCGAWMIGDSGRNHAKQQYLYYTCGTHKRDSKACPKRTERKHELEALALKLCRAALTDDIIESVSRSAAAKLAAEAAQNDITPQLKAQLSEVDKKIKNILSAIEEGIFTATTKDRLTELEAQRADLEERLAIASVPKVVPTAEEFIFYLQHFRAADVNDESVNRTLIDNFLNSITLYDLPENKKKAVFAFNLTANTATLEGSDLTEMMELSQQYPNTAIYKYKVFTTYIIIESLSGSPAKAQKVRSNRLYSLPVPTILQQSE